MLGEILFLIGVIIIGGIGLVTVFLYEMKEASGGL